MKIVTFISLIIYTLTAYGQVGDSVYQFTDTSGAIYNVHAYTSTGTNTFEVPSNVNKVDVLIVAGGGGGAGYTSYNSAGGGAGGAGGLVFDSAYAVISGSIIPIVVGAGGTGINSTGNAADNGENSEFDGIIALGGGGGILTGGNNNNSANDGGSGGGGRQNSPSSALQPSSSDGGFGNDGAINSTDNGGAGGGGAGSTPLDISGNDGGDGGDGLDFSGTFGTLYGESGFFAGGGGGGGDANGGAGLGGQGGGGNGSSAMNNTTPTPGISNSGGGGGGGSSDHIGADGGSGIILIRYVEDPNPLPIDLLSFYATNLEKEVQLDWTTASEQNNDYFALQRSRDGYVFETLANVAGAGNSNINNYYSYLDLHPFDGVSYYRLIQKDFDGDSTISKTISVNRTIKNVKDLIIKPNPNNGNFELVIFGNKDEVVRINIWNDLGEMLFDLNLNIYNYGTTSIPIHENLTAGVYVISITSADGDVKKGKLVVH